MDPVAGAAKTARVLRPGGRLAVFRNAAQLPPDLGEALAGVYRRVQPGLPFNPWAMSVLGTYQAMCGTAAGGMRQASAFGDPEQWRFDWDRPYTRDEWLAVLPAFGGHSQIPPAKLEALLAGIGAAVDAMGGSFTMRYATMVVTATRVPRT